MPTGRARQVACSIGAIAAALLPVTHVAPAGALVPVIAIDGRGFGHGVGMAQDGALEMGRRGFSLPQILGQFYPGVSLAHASGDVRVAVLGAAPAVRVTFPDGGEVDDARSGAQSAGFPLSVPPDGTVVFGRDGDQYTATIGGAAPGATSTTPAPSTTVAAPARSSSPSTSTTQPLVPLTVAPPPPTRAPTTTSAPRSTTTSAPITVPRPAAATASATPAPAAPASATPATAAPAAGAASSRPLWAVPRGNGAIGVPDRGRLYRGVVETVGTPGGVRLVNEVDVDTYLAGMGEVQDPSWPPAALEAQEVAARTYALRAMATGGELCDDTRCQVYLGADGEYPAAQRAVAATAGMVMVWGGSLIDAVYSANAAGFSATRLEGFGIESAEYPYLRAAPYPNRDPVPWMVEVATADVAARLGLHPPLTNVAVASKGPSGRALSVTLTAGGQTVTVTGLAFAAALGLRSTMIDAIRAMSATTAPPPLPPASVLQVLPDNAGSVAAAAAPTPRTSTSTTDPLGVPANEAAPATHGQHTNVPVAVAGLAAALLILVSAAAARQRRYS